MNASHIRTKIEGKEFKRYFYVYSSLSYILFFFTKDTHFFQMFIRLDLYLMLQITQAVWTIQQNTMLQIWF
jgi:2-polyprenyl-3-methyl-5-hydroxy-6-metoxy-1,4-benzoquinol methylase